MGTYERNGKAHTLPFLFTHFDIVDYYYKREKTEAIFTQKRPYKIINSRLLNALNNSEGLKKYVDEQKETFAKIVKVLEEYK